LLFPFPFYKQQATSKKQMKTEIQQIGNHEITFYIGKNSADNFAVLDAADENDMWFHLQDVPSCHVVASLKDHDMANKKELHKIIVAGACLCKKNTAKYASTSYVEVIYTKVKNVVKTEVIGSVLTTNTKSMRV